MQVEGILMKVPQVSSEYRIVLETINDVDEMIVEVEIKNDLTDDQYRSLEQITKRLVHEIRDEVLAKPIVKLVEPGTIQRQEGKAIRVFDNRKKYETSCLF
jgi:phenylacetate-CoA ligase